MALPYDIRDQIIQCIGNCFHYKDNVESFFISCGIDRHLARKYRDSPKFVWARKLLNELENTQDGDILQKKIITELCKLRKLPDNNVPNPDAGIKALRILKEIANQNKIEVDNHARNIEIRNKIAKEKAKIIEERAHKLSNLKKQLADGLLLKDRQRAGYNLENILESLFPLFEIEYRKAYKTETQQIDGHFRFEGFDYLVEAKCTKDKPNEHEIAGFERKITTKLESTRGIFVSINGFRDEVVKQFEGKGSKIILFSGEDIMHILEGRIDLRDVLRFKIEKAAQEGKVFFPVSNFL